MPTLLLQIDRIISKGKIPVKYPDGFRLLDMMQLELMRKRAEELDSNYLGLLELSRRSQGELDKLDKENSVLMNDNKRLKFSLMEQEAELKGLRSENLDLKGQLDALKKNKRKKDND